MILTPTWKPDRKSIISTGEVLSGSRQGVLLRVRVVPGASRNQVAGEIQGRLRLRIQSPPVEGAANRELVKYVAGLFGLRKSRVTIVKGDASREKTLLLEGRNLDEARAALKSILSEG